MLKKTNLFLIILLFICFFTPINTLYSKNSKKEQLYYKRLVIATMGVSKLLNLKPSLLIAVALKESLLKPCSLHIKMPIQFYKKHISYFKKYPCSRNRNNTKVSCTILTDKKQTAKRLLSLIQGYPNISYDVGIMQINKRKIAESGLTAADFLNFDINLLYGAKILKKCLYKAHNDINKALICYRYGERKINMKGNVNTKYNNTVSFISMYLSDVFKN